MSFFGINCDLSRAFLKPLPRPLFWVGWKESRQEMIYADHPSKWRCFCPHSRWTINSFDHFSICSAISSFHVTVILCRHTWSLSDSFAFLDYEMIPRVGRCDRCLTEKCRTIVDNCRMKSQSQTLLWFLDLDTLLHETVEIVCDERGIFLGPIWCPPIDIVWSDALFNSNMFTQRFIYFKPRAWAHYRIPNSKLLQLIFNAKS